MTVLPECGCNTLGHRHDPNPPVLRRCQLAAPIRVTDIDLLPLVVDVSPLQRDDLANPKPTLAPQENKSGRCASRWIVQRLATAHTPRSRETPRLDVKSAAA